MAYQVLARKWRPQTFDAVVGQEAVTRTVRNAVAAGRVAHAYLFAGPRGVGKTTTARLLAKALACTARTGTEACAVCPSCLDFASGSPMDVLEIDAASHNGVEEIRTLRENVKYAPARGRFKVYIVDEVHMLSGSAFNAFLKTLEEPPAHVVFILATTEPRKIPPTVLSRCQRFDFRPIPPELLVARLREILAAEGVPFEPGALPLLVRASEGSLRDALSLLDAAIAYGEGRVEEASVARLLGASSPLHVRGFLLALLACDPAAALEGIDRAARQGDDLEVFCREAVEAARRLLVLTAAPGAAVADLSPSEAEELAKAAGSVTVDELLYLMRALLEAQAEMRRSPHARVELEMAAVRAARRPRPQAIEALLAKVEEVERKLRAAPSAGPAPRAAAVQASLLEPPGGPALPTRPQTAPPREPGAPAVAAPGPPVSGGSGRAEALGEHGDPPPAGARTGLAEAWQRVVADIMARKATLGAVLQHATPLGVLDGTLLIGIVGNRFHTELLAERAHRDLIARTVEQHVPGARRIEVTPEEAAGAGALRHPAVQAAIAVFGGEVVAVRRRGPEEGESR